ncbi:hypothetical protein SCLCIDRAFT_1224002 [Scleroderma citrinum Foug A]|uniref:Uncharacterized protein n=1 Tax=Scleroderma citrinum Foug A TaxID=1036808 RepID=A0A0C3CUC3_9AGAM|nr:hypothetical protein SCLCIDRAFT_1224002 [Scleroderma citrinum Foug A]
MDTAAQLPASTTYLHLLCCVRSHPSFIIMIINVTHRCVPALAFLVWQFGDGPTRSFFCSKSLGMECIR